MKTRQKIRFALITSSLLLFPATIYYFSPVISLEAASHGIIAGSLLVFAAQLLIALAGGRAFCGWVCPAGGLQDVIGISRTKAVNARRIRWFKYLIWAPWLAGVLLFIRRAGGPQQVNALYATEGGLSVTSVPGLIAYLSVVLVFLSLSLIVGRRAACHTICWMAPFMNIGRLAGRLFHLPALRIVAGGRDCRRCGRCTRSCPMSIPVEESLKSGSIRDVDCILCGSCVDNCSSGAIRFSFSREREVSRKVG